jgi:hypothetical protein
MRRRTFLRHAAGAATALGAVPALHAEPDTTKQKLLIVVFGGGTRSRDTIDDPAHKFIPRLWRDMVPRGTLFTNMRVEHKVVHPNSTGSMMTGHWEYDHIDWSRPVAHPTVFEVYRRERQAPDTKAWAFVYASILAKTGESETYGTRFAANVVEPPTVPRSAADEIDRLMREGNASGSLRSRIEAVRACARLARSASRIRTTGLRSAKAKAFLDEQYAAWKAGSGTTSHDAFLTDRAIACMRVFEPDVLVVAYGEIDCAHYGSWSRYTEAIRRTDALTHKLWSTAQKHPAYRGRTRFLIAPDHGRELEESGGSGFVHHSDFYTGKGADEGCRRIWMLALGPGVAAGRQIAKGIPLTAVAATGLDHLGLAPPPGAAASALGATT